MLPGRESYGSVGRQFPVAAIPDGLNVIIMTSSPDRTILDWWANPEKGTVVRSWNEVMDLIGSRYGQGTKVAVLPNATMQYYG